MNTDFQKLQALHSTHMDKVKSRVVVADKAEADLAERLTEA